MHRLACEYCVTEFEAKNTGDVALYLARHLRTCGETRSAKIERAKVTLF